MHFESLFSHARHRRDAITAARARKLRDKFLPSLSLALGSMRVCIYSGNESCIEIEKNQAARSNIETAQYYVRQKEKKAITCVVYVPRAVCVPVIELLKRAEWALRHLSLSSRLNWPMWLSRGRRGVVNAFFLFT